MAPPRFPLTTVASGRVADVDMAGRIELAGAAWSASWWVAEGDRWRRPEAEAAVRSRLVDEAAVVETSMRVGGGDVRSTARAFVPMGSAHPAVGVDIANDTPIPVAVALVVGPVRHARLDGDTLFLDGAPAARFARRPAHWAGASSPHELESNVTPTAEPHGELHVGPGGWVVVVSPLPHGVSLQWVVGRDLGVGSYPVPPTPEQVASGWMAHADRGAHTGLADPNEAEALRRARMVLAGLRPDEVMPLDVVAEVGRAAIRLGWADHATAAAGLLADAQDGNGAIGDAATTLAAIDVFAGRWRLGATPEEMEPSVLPLASALSALVGRRRRPAVVSLPGAAAVLARAGAACSAIDQPDLAGAFAGASASSVDPGVEANGPGPGPWGLAHLADGSVDVAAAAREVTRLLDGLVGDGGTTVDLCRGWRADQVGVGIEVLGVPTAAGRVSFAIRWHGRRPALLWEVEPWPGRSDDLHLTATAIDPDWSATALEGEALLAEPAAIASMTSILGTVVDVLGPPDVIDGPGEGTSFS